MESKNSCTHDKFERRDIVIDGVVGITEYKCYCKVCGRYLHTYMWGKYYYEDEEDAYA